MSLSLLKSFTFLFIIIEPRPMMPVKSRLNIGHCPKCLPEFALRKLTIWVTIRLGFLFFSIPSSSESTLTDLNSSQSTAIRCFHCSLMESSTVPSPKHYLHYLLALALFILFALNDILLLYHLHFFVFLGWLRLGSTSIFLFFDSILLLKAEVKIMERSRIL